MLGIARTRVGISSIWIWNTLSTCIRCTTTLLTRVITLFTIGPIIEIIGLTVTIWDRYSIGRILTGSTSCRSCTIIARICTCYTSCISSTIVKSRVTITTRHRSGSMGTYGTGIYITCTGVTFIVTFYLHIIYIKISMFIKNKFVFTWTDCISI